MNSDIALKYSGITNPYAHAKAKASYEMTILVHKLNYQGCFVLKKKEEYIPCVLSAHELAETASELARICKKNDITVIWDPGVYAEKGMGALISIIKYTDYFVLNQLEYDNLLGTSEPEKIVKALSKYAEGLKVIIKKGAHGCILIDDEDNFIEMEALPLGKLKMKVVNTVGCGDAFIGSFASAKVKGYSDIESLRMASAAGSFKATRKETRGGPTAKELQNLLSLWKNI